MQPVQVSATAVCSCRYTEAFIDFLTGKRPQSGLGKALSPCAARRLPTMGVELSKPTGEVGDYGLVIFRTSVDAGSSGEPSFP